MFLYYLLLAGAIIILFPLAVFITMKVGTYGFLMARDQFKKKKRRERKEEDSSDV